MPAKQLSSLENSIDLLSPFGLVCETGVYLMVSIKDIAAKVGLSPSSVSRILNGKQNINSEKRDYIKKVARDLGYVPNRAARSMVMKKTFTVGIVIPDMFNMFQRQLFSIIEHQLEYSGYHTLFFFVKNRSSSEEECLNKIKGELLDGLILLHEIRNQKFYEYCNNAHIPTVLSTFTMPNLDFPSIHVHEEVAAYEAMLHLINLGHHSIAMINCKTFSFGKQRAEGFFKALEEINIPRDLSIVSWAKSYSSEAGLYATRELLLRRKDFTAIFAATDELAIGAIRALQDAGIRVPQDVSVVGFDDIEIASYYCPRLTTIRQPLQDMGERTASLLHHSINNDELEQKYVILPHELIIRESTKQCIV